MNGNGFIDRTGQRFGCLTVLRRVPAAGRVRWECRCDCGRLTVAQANNLQSGNTRSCGHLGENNTSQMTHGHTRSGWKSPTFVSWSNMVQRCVDRRSTSWLRYGGRGIKVCARWRTFENFLADMGERPAGRSIDRIDNAGHYRPGNCKWSTPKEQAANRRRACR